MTPALKIFALIVGNLVLVGLLGEGVLRMTLEPRDYLPAGQVEDDSLPFALVPNSAGHDAWGYRNARVPQKADIVALGDSWTYGNAAAASESWPSWLERATGKTVYNLGVYGYGPTDYLHLLKLRGLALHPELIIVGLAKSDFHEAYTSVYTHDEWAYLRSSAHVYEAIPERVRGGGRLMDVWRSNRNWLRANSMLYQVIERGPIGRAVNRRADRARADNPEACVLQTSPPFPTYFRVSSRAMDLRDPRIAEGLRLSLAVLREISQEAARRGIRTLVALFPTKATIYQGFMAETAKVSCLEKLERAIESELEIDSRVKAYLDAHGIDYVDTLPALRDAVNERRIFLPSLDVHPNGEGYRVISERIEQHLSTGRGESPAPAAAS